jgi:hypothetical protein
VVCHIDHESDNRKQPRTRWHNHVCPLQVFLLGGSWKGGRGGKTGEILSDGVWQLLSGVSATSILTADPQGVYRADNHGWFFGWSNEEGAIRPPLNQRWQCRLPTR